MNFHNKMGDKIFTTSMKTFTRNVLELMKYSQIKGQSIYLSIIPNPRIEYYWMSMHVILILQSGLLFQAHILILNEEGIFKENIYAICFSPKLYFCVKMYLIFHIRCKWLPLALTNGCVKKVRSAVKYVLVIPYQKRVENCSGT